MRRRNRVIIGLLASIFVGILASYFYATYDPDAPRSDWPILQSAKNSQQPFDVVVGPNVQVSQTDDSVTYWECVLAADANDAKRLVTAVILRKSQPETDIVCFYSHNGGTTWKQGCHQICPKGHQFFDPAVAFGPDGIAYLAYMDVDQSTSTEKKDAGSLVFLASLNGGESWEKRDVFPEFVDRPWLVVDRTFKKNHATVYCIGQVDRRSAEGQKTHPEPIFFFSTDELETLSPPRFPHVGRQMINCRPANPVVFSDGTLLIAYQDRYLKRHINIWPRPAIYTMSSTDGGHTFEESTPVNTKWWHDTIASSGNSVVGAEFPQLAVDASGSEYNDRLYCVWTDGRSEGQETHDGSRIFFSSSLDQGETWSQPVVLSEQPMAVGQEPEYASFVPTIAVNSDGVIAVGWYDRRGLAGAERVYRKNQQGVFDTISDGWNFRVRLSLDGGTTWTSSVQVNEEAGKGAVYVGHTAGLAASPDGRFHFTWVDNRTGKNKLWTSAVELGAVK